MLIRTVRGVAASLVLGALLVGVPIALTGLAGNPLDVGAEGLLAGFLRPDLDGTFLMETLLPLLGWAAWAYFAASVVLEVVRLVAAPRRPRARRRSPGPALAAVLLGAIVVLGSPPGALHSATHAGAVHSLSADAIVNTERPTASHTPPDDIHGSTDAAPRERPAPWRIGDHEVPAPAAGSDLPGPVGGTPTVTAADGDSLWRIAERHLGSGERYTELLDLNLGVPQANGGRLGNDLWLDAGWVIRLPADASPGTAAVPDPGNAHRDTEERSVTPPEQPPSSAPGTGPSVPAAPDVPTDSTVTVAEGDTLWGLAEEHYDDGSRYPEIAAANGLADPDLIDVGSRLVVPGSDATGSVPPAPDTQDTGDAGDADSTGDADDAETDGSQGDDAQGDGAEQPAPDTTPPAETAAAPTPPDEQGAPPTEAPPTEATAAPEASAPAPSEPTSSTPAAGDVEAGDASTSASGPEAPDADEEPELLDLRTAGGIGGVLAAGLLGWLAVRRQLQRRRRRPGERIPAPDHDASAIEQELHAVDDGGGMEVIDLATRRIAVWAQDSGAHLPSIYAARLSEEELSIYLELPAELPPPFHPVAEDGAAWAVDPRALEPLERIPSAPYPALVTLGQDAAGAHLLVDLERLGALDVRGAPGLVDGALAAIAIELVTSSWCDDLQVTLVGIDPGLPRALDTGRLRHVDDVESLLRNLRGQAADTRAALHEVGAENLAVARGAGPDAQPWMPEIVLVGTELDDGSRAELAELATAMPRLGIAAVARGRLADTWTLELPNRNDAVLVLPGGAGRIPLDPQIVTARDRERLSRLAASTELAPVARPASASDELDGVRPTDDVTSSGTIVPPPPAWPETGGWGSVPGRLDQPDREDPLAPEWPEFGEPDTAWGPPDHDVHDPAPEWPDHDEQDPSTAWSAPADRTSAPERADHGDPADAPEVAERAQPFDPSNGDHGRVAPDDARHDEFTGWPDDAFEFGDTAEGRTATGRTTSGQIAPGPSAAGPSAAGHTATGHESDADADADGTAETRPLPSATDRGATARVDRTDSEAATADTAEAMAGDGPVEPHADELDAAGRALLSELTRVPWVRLLGPVALHGAEGEPPRTPRTTSVNNSSVNRATELVAFMTVNPGASAVQVHAAFWPGKDPQGKTAASSRNGLATRTRRWLGNAEDGSPFFPHVGSGGYRLHPDVTTDWHVFRALVGDDVRHAPTSRLRAALELVEGQPISGVKDRYYGWAEVARTEMLAAIGDTCHELSERLLERGDPHAARVPAALGRDVDPVNETCWRDALLAELGAGDRDGFERIVAQLTRRLDDLEDGYEPEDETQLIIDRARATERV